VIAASIGVSSGKPIRKRHLKRAPAGQSTCAECEFSTARPAAVAAASNLGFSYNKAVITIAIRLRYDDTTTHSTTTEGEITI